MTEFLTNAAGIRFYIEASMDFADNGAMIAGRGFHAGLVVGNDMLGGVWFETREAAVDAISNWKG